MTDDKTLRQLYETHQHDPDVMQHILEVFEDRSSRSIKQRLTRLGLRVGSDKQWLKEVSE